ncbi:YncE family protein [Streptomyces sp. HUAS TT20]|uniref:YncE family protein n=1 Tax=Streptomyces sp. HUAS TT20 TaxID=3447509 RepID=UPI0021DA2614|nr:Ig-like domain repeat protein [Streptomyces sp. HUAS 15-9]UXY28793.1 Ig-like domain repeat protein [Streptomyces sp. HUAS 15-9]
MRIRTLPAAAALAALIGSTALAVPASADSDRPIPVSDTNDMVVDGVHQHVFLSDSSHNQIVVTDYSGKVVGTVTGLSLVKDLELSPDSGTLYAAVYGADKIVAIDTTHLTQTAEYPTGALTIPSRLAYADGKLWFGYGDQWDSGLGVVDLTAQKPTVTLDLAAGHDFASPPELYADPDNPGTLVALDAHISSGPMVVYDISSGTPAIRVSADKGGFYHDAALTPDGRHIVVAGPGNRALTEYRLSDLAEVRTYPVASEPETVSVAPDGTVAATVLDTDDLGDTYVFPGDTGRPASVRNLAHDWMPWGGHSMNWSADGTKLFVQTGTDTSTRLHTVDEPRKYATTLTVNAPSTAPRAKSLTVTGKLTAGLALPAGTPLKVTRTDLDSPNGKSLGTKSLGSGGKFSFTDTPPAGSKVTYTVTYAGDAAHTSASASDTVDVSRARPTLSVDNNGKVYSYGADVKFTAHLGSTYKNRTVEIWADPFGSDKPNKLAKKGTVNSSGNLSVTLDLKRDTKVTAKFSGDARYQPRSVSSTVGAKVKVSTSVSRQYKTKSTWGHTYYFFHKSRNPLFTTTMTYFPGRQQRLEFQVYYQGRWYDSGSRYFPLGSNGVSRVELRGDHGQDVGWRFRARSSYFNSTSGDTVNSTTHGAWKYFTFTS